jgi:hypothetical protein
MRGRGSGLKEGWKRCYEIDFTKNYSTSLDRLIELFDDIVDNLIDLCYKYLPDYCNIADISLIFLSLLIDDIV